MEINEIMKNLTIEEKIKLLNGKGSWFTYDCNGKIPSIMMIDGPHGLRKQMVESLADMNNSKIATCFPTASAISSSWDTEIASKLANAIADEALKEKVSIVLGCGINIKRNPLCGRNFEYFSEDPYLTGKLATAYISTMEEKGIATSLKHFAVNNQERKRQTQNSIVDERALREIYLSAFEMVVKNAKPKTIMASYNRLNGEYACENKRLINDILKEEWGYKGLVISDWGAVTDVVKCIKAGLDIEMPSSNGFQSEKLLLAYKTGELTIEEIDRSVEKIISFVILQNSKILDKEVDYKKHHIIAKNIATECAVLLKNENEFLPLSKEQSVLVVGEMATEMRFQGGGSSHITTVKTKNALEGLQDFSSNIQFAIGYSDDKTDSKMISEAVEMAKDVDVVLFFGGLSEKFEGEGYDRKNLRIPPCHIELLEKIHAVNKNIAFISFGGSPIEMLFLGKVKSVLHMYLGGQGVGEATASLVYGETCPSGKLAETFPRSIDDVPSTATFSKETNNVEYRESIFVGYRYFDSYNVPTLFDFGFGLSYTSFEYSNLELSDKRFEDGELKISITIKNIGKVKGKEIVEVYVKNPSSNFMRANRELIAFKKVELNVGESKVVEMMLSKRNFSIYHVDSKKFVVPSGIYEIQVGSSLNDIRQKSEVEVVGVEIQDNQKTLLSEYFKNTLKYSQSQFAILTGSVQRDFNKIKKGQYTAYNTMEELSRTSLLGKIVLKSMKKSLYSMNKGKKKDSPELMMMVSGVTEGPLISVMNNSEGAITVNIVDGIVLWANGKYFKSISLLTKKNK